MNQPLFPKHAAEIARRIEQSRSRNQTLARSVIDRVRRHGMQQHVVIMSFAPVVCATTLLEAPELRTELLACSDKNDPGQWPQYLVLEKMLNAPGFNPGLTDVTPELVRDLHARGKTIAVWTANDPADMQRLIAWGVDTLISDKPDVALRTVREEH